MRRFFWITIIVVALVVLAFFSPWRKINIDLATLFGIEQAEKSSGLSVSSFAGEIEVYVDGKLEGIASPAVPLILPKVAEGERLIKLTRKSEVPQAYYSYSKLLPLVEGTEVQIAYELGPTQEFSGGHVIRAAGTRTSDTKNVRLSVSTNVSDVEIYLDDSYIGLSPLSSYTLSTGSQHRLELRRPGYDTQVFTILPEAQEDRDRLAGYVLDVTVDMFLQPIDIQFE